MKERINGRRKRGRTGERNEGQMKRRKMVMKEGKN